MSFEQLLEATGLDKKILRAITENQYVPSPQQRKRIAAALKVEPEEIAWSHSIGVENIHGHGPQFGRSP